MIVAIMSQVDILPNSMESLKSCHCQVTMVNSVTTTPGGLIEEHAMSIILFL